MSALPAASSSRRRSLALLPVALSLAACAPLPPADTSGAASYDAVIASAIRTDQDRRMDASRRPAEFLPFTQVGAGMQVLDVSTGGGYTSQLLALAVGAQGRLYAQAPQPGAAVTKRLADHPQPNFVLVARPFEDPVPPGAPPLDLITIVLNYHDIAYLPVDRAKMNRRLFDALKPGGRLVIVDHSARAGTGIADTKSLHRIDEAVVRSELQQAGFVLDAEGAFLRNPADARDQSSNNPPVPTDKFALRFVRPR